MAWRTQSVLLFFVGSSVACGLLSARLRWPDLRWLWLAMYPVIVWQLGLDLLNGAHPFANLGAVAWAATFAAHFWLLARHSHGIARLTDGLHAAGLWLLALVGARELGWWVDRAVAGGRDWPDIAWAVVPAALLFAISWGPVSERWPVSAHGRAYRAGGAAPLAVFLALWVLYMNFTRSGDPRPLPYVPVINPLDLAIGAAFVLVGRWLSALRHTELAPGWASARTSGLAAFAGSGFVWANGMLLRTLHHWVGLPFALEPMLHSRLVQASFSIFWTLLALATMLFATRRGSRPTWLCGATLMAVVVVKLLLVDLSGGGTVERIVSFMGVGVLMLVIGYFSPAPPRTKTQANPA